MFKIVRIGDRAVFKFKNLTSKRSFLSEAYQCQEAWQQRFNSPLLQKVKKSSMFYELENRFQNTGQISALDIDLFVNSTTDDHQTDEIINLLIKFRKTAETSHTLDSTHHAVIRHFMNHNHINQLLPILHDRLNYGIFPDHFCYNLLMDTLIKEKDFTSASKVAVLLMLQEDSDHPISNALCVYSCHKYLENPIDWEIEENKPEEPVEEVKVRVKYIINPYFDDHFDLRNSKDLVGKTLAFQGKLMNDALGRSLLLRGLVLYKKYTKANHLIQKWLKENTKDIVFPEIFDLIKKDNSHLPEEQITDEYKELLNQLDSLQKFNSYQGNLDEAVEKTVQSAVERCKEEDVAKQIQFYQEWEEKRKLVLDQQMKEINRLSRLAKIKEIKEDLENKERLLTFFDKEEQIELEIERKALIDKQNCEKLQYQLNKIVLEEEYIPPDVKKRKQ